MCFLLNECTPLQPSHLQGHLHHRPNLLSTMATNFGQSKFPLWMIGIQTLTTTTPPRSTAWIPDDYSQFPFC